MLAQLCKLLPPLSGADLSDYFNYGFNEETWKAYCEKQRRLQLGLDPAPPINTENKITVGDKLLLHVATTKQ